MVLPFPSVKIKKLTQNIPNCDNTDTSETLQQNSEFSMPMLAVETKQRNKLRNESRDSNTKNKIKHEFTETSPSTSTHKSDRNKYKCFLGEFETPIYWGNLFGIIFLHIGTLYCLYPLLIFLEPWTLAYGILIGGLGGFGITGGAHRYWTHRCYKAKLPLKIILLICYSIAGQNNLLEWVRDHRVHHKFSETDADPHNSRRGFFFSHVGWLCMKKHPEVLRRGKTVDVSDITSDPLLAFHIRYWMWFKLVFCFIIPTIIPPYLYGESWKTTILANWFVRYCLLLNFTWSVNSFAHIWGNRPYNREIRPVENTFVSIVAMGEGWHNYHHSFPWDYRASELGKFLNVTTLIINFFAKIGWAYDLKTASPELVEKMIKTRGDGSHEAISPGY